MKLVVRVRWWRVLVALLVAPSCLARPSILDSDSESWKPISGHRANRYRTALRLTPVVPSGQSSFKHQVNLRIRHCLGELQTKNIDSLVNRIVCLRLKNEFLLRESLFSERVKDRKPDGNNGSVQIDVKKLNDEFNWAKNSSADIKTVPLGLFRNQQSTLGPNKTSVVHDNSLSESGARKQRRRRRSDSSPRRSEIKPPVDKVKEVSDEEELKWLPVSLAPPNKDDGETKTNFVTQDLVNNFVTNSLPDLKLPHESTGTIVQIVSPLLSKHPSKWGSSSLDNFVLPHSPHPQPPHSHNHWHKKPTVILVQETPEEFLPKPPHNHQYHHHNKPEAEPFPTPEHFPKPTYHFPSPEPYPKPKPTYHYPSTHKPVYHYKPSTHKPIIPVHHHYPTPEPQFPYTSVVIHTSTSFHPDSYPEPSPEPPWSSQAHYPLPEPEPDDPDPEPEIIVGDDEPVPEPSPEPPASDSPFHDEPSGPSPPPIFTTAPPVAPPASPLNPTTITTGQRPPSIVILSSPEDDPSPSPALDSPVDTVGGGPGGGGGIIPLVPLIPPIISGIPAVVNPGGLGALAAAGNPGGNSECPSVQLFNFQSVTNNAQNKDCVINLNSPINNDGQIEPPIIQSDEEIPDSSTVATTTKKPSSSSSSMSIFEHIVSFFASMTIFNPISLSFWSFLFAPVSVLLASGLGLAALVLPWFFPSYWLGRKSESFNRRVDYIRGSNGIRDSTIRFERSLKAGMDLDSFLESIGLL